MANSSARNGACWPGDCVRMSDHAVDRRKNGILHFHRLDGCESLSATHPIAGFRLDRDHDAADRRANRAVRRPVLELRRRIGAIDEATDGAFEIEPEIVPVARVGGGAR